jgi:hypothetical protein
LNIKHGLAASALLAGSIGSGIAAAQFPPAELAIHELREGIYLIQSMASGNITVLTSDDGVLLVDSKFER